MAERPRELGDFKAVGHFERKFQTEVGVAHQPLLDVSKPERLSFRVVSKYPQCALFGFVTKHVCDGRTDRVTTTPKSIAARAVKI